MKILIVGPSWVGDMVMAQTLFQCLQQRHPGCEIDVLAPEWSRPILERMPEVRQALSFPLGHGALELATRRKIGKSLAGQYDQRSPVNLGGRHDLGQHLILSKATTVAAPFVKIP